ncbi:hypothetical protein [Thermoactinospora rubra]|uniref:hypothetical protein n=1 Tax=Thermoactinospora rubra TaxID=1088767 RepID=UPI00117E460C|nr:hypothetical protein [Thermoactinospora rubra]
MTTKQDLAAGEGHTAAPTASSPTSPLADPQTAATDNAKAEGGTAGEGRAAAPAATATESEATSTSAPTGAAAGTDDEGGGDDGGERAKPRRQRLAAGAVAVVAVVALAAAAVLQWLAAGRAEEARARLEAERALRVEVSGAAHAFGQSLLSYDYQDLQTSRSTLMGMATGDFLATYDEAFGGAMEQVIIKLKAVAEATVRAVYLAEVDEATAQAIVVVDQQVKTSESIRVVRDSYLKLTMVKQKGTWKVQEVTVLGAAKEQETKLGGDQKAGEQKDTAKPSGKDD